MQELELEKGGEGASAIFERRQIHDQNTAFLPAKRRTGQSEVFV